MHETQNQKWPISCKSLLKPQRCIQIKQSKGGNCSLVELVSVPVENASCIEGSQKDTAWQHVLGTMAVDWHRALTCTFCCPLFFHQHLPQGPPSDWGAQDEEKLSSKCLKRFPSSVMANNQSEHGIITFLLLEKCQRNWSCRVDWWALEVLAGIEPGKLFPLLPCHILS